MLVQDEKYDETIIKVLKFVEVTDAEEIKKEKSNVKEQEEEHEKDKKILTEAEASESLS